MATAAKASAERRVHVALIAILVGCGVAALNIRILGFDWVLFDDDINVLTNPFLGRAAGSSVRWAFSQFDYIRRYVPLGWLWFDGVLGVAGYNPAAFHAVSMLLHGLNATLAVFVFRAGLRQSFRQTAGLDNRVNLAAGLGALLWSVHPLRAENVGWISGQFYLLATTFALLATWAFICQTPEVDEARPMRRVRVGGVLCFTASLLVYPVYLALPAVLTLWQIALQPTWHGTRGAFRRTGTWWLVALIVAAVNRYAAATATGGFALTGSHLSALPWIGHCAAAYLHYAGSTIWPADIAVFYGTAPSHWSTTPTQVMAWIALAILAAAVVTRGTRLVALMLAGGIVLSLAPFIAQMDATFTPSDRYAVLWLAVLGIAAAALLVRTKTRALFLVGMVVAAGWTVGFTQALGQWQDTFALQRAIDERTASHRNPKVNFGRAALAAWWLGRRAEAEQRLAAGLTQFPGNPGLLETKTYLAGLDELYRARVGDGSAVPPLAVHHVDLGNRWLAQGERSAAEAHFLASLHLAPDYGEAIVGLRHTAR